ncbi:MAG: MFS transporter [Eubacterium sp.]
MEKKNKQVKLWSKDFIFIIVINFLVFLNHLMILSTFPFFVSYLGYSDSVSGACATIFSFVAVICRPFIGWMLDNGKRRTILLVGICAMALMPVGYLLVYTAVSSIVLAIVFRMVHGIALACSNTSTSTIATDIIPKPRFSEGMGMFGMATALATACAPAIGEALMKKGFNVLFLVATAIMVISLILFAFLKTPKIEMTKKPLRAKDLVDKDALPASAVVLIFLLTYGALENYILKFTSESENITVSGGLYFTIMAVMLFLTRVTIGKVADKKGEEIFVYTCNALMLVALILLSVIPNNVTFIISAALSGYAFGGIEPSLQAMAVNIAPPERRGAANSTFLCAYDIGIGLGGGIAGVLIDAVDYNKMFAIIAIANIVSVVIYIAWGRKHPSSITYRIKNSK